MSNDPTQPCPGPDAQRLDRLEELVLFAERRQDELNGAMLDLAARLGRVARTLDELSARVSALYGAPTESDPSGVDRPETGGRETDHGVAPGENAGP